MRTATILPRDEVAAAPDTSAWSTGGRGTALALLLLRVALGIVFIAHAILKVQVFGLPGTAAFFASVGYPEWSAYLVFAIELLGGIALVVGYRTRLAALLLVPVMVGAFLVHLPNGWRFDAPGGGWEFVAFLIAALCAQALAGNHPVMRGTG